MFDFLRWHDNKYGTPPGTAAYAGSEKSFTPQLLHCAFTETSLSESVQPLDAPMPVMDDEHLHMFVIGGVHDPEGIKRVGELFNLHPLVVEDILNTGHRPKCEELDDSVFLTLRQVEYQSGTQRLNENHISILCADNYVTAFHEGEESPFEGVLGRLRRGKGRIRKTGTMYLAIALVDALVDGYYLAMRSISDDVERLEDELEDDPSEASLLELYRLKRLALSFRNAILPAQQVLNSLEVNETVSISDAQWPYLQDVRDHMAQVADAVTTLHDMLGSMLDLHISLAGMRMNSIMKFLTIIATIFIPLTFIAGLYGMNFQYMPELHWRWSYPLVIGLMLGVAVVMILYFRKKRWL